MPLESPIDIAAALATGVEGPMAAEDVLENLRWTAGRAVCVHCGFRRSYRMVNEEVGRVRFKCARCRKQYSTRHGTVLERSNVPTQGWLTAMTLFVSTPRSGMAARIQRATGVSYKTAWSMVDRMRSNPGDIILAAVRRQVLPELAAHDHPVRDSRMQTSAVAQYAAGH